MSGEDGKQKIVYSGIVKIVVTGRTPDDVSIIHSLFQTHVINICIFFT